MWKSQVSKIKKLIVRPDLFMSTTLSGRRAQLSDAFVERQSRLVSLIYRVLGTMELPALEASEREVLDTLASAFHRKAQATVEAVLDKPAPKKSISVFSSRVPFP
jgi:hypothetical protein